MNEYPHDSGYPILAADDAQRLERIVLPSLLDSPKHGELHEISGNVTACTKRDKGHFYTPYQPQTRVVSLPLLDESIAEVVKVRLLAEDWNSPRWIELGGDPKKLNLGPDIGWGQWFRAGEEYQQVGGKVARVWAGYFFNGSDTRARLTAINVVFRYR